MWSSAWGQLLLKKYTALQKPACLSKTLEVLLTNAGEPSPLSC